MNLGDVGSESVFVAARNASRRRRYPGIVWIAPAPGDAVVEIAGLPCQDAPSAIRSASPVIEDKMPTALWDLRHSGLSSPEQCECLILEFGSPSGYCPLCLLLYAISPPPRRRLHDRAPRFPPSSIMTLLTVSTCITSTTAANNFPFGKSVSVNRHAFRAWNGVR